MSIKNLLSSNNKPDQDVKVDTIEANSLNATTIDAENISSSFSNNLEFAVNRDLVTVNYASTTTANIASTNSIVTWINWPSHSNGVAVPVDIIYAGFTTSTPIHITCDSNGSETVAGTANWFASIRDQVPNGVQVNAVYVSSVGMSTNTQLRMHIFIIPDSVP
jgi:hypothetical protein